jgi:hypothetical protein
MNVRSFLPRIREWLLRTSALREARAAVAGREGHRSRAVAQAQLLTEVARRVAAPIESLPTGSRAAVEIALCRDATYWALAALRPDPTSAPDLATLSAEVPPAELERLAGGADAAERVRRTLTDDVPAHALGATDDDAARVRSFADALVAELDVPRRRVDRVRFQRGWRLGLAAASLLFAGYGVHAVFRGPNLVARKPFRTSSSYPWCPCQGLLFHTNEENNPWVEFDLGAVKPIKRLEIENRQECCQERAAPLVAEVSTDRAQWTQVARREKEFDSWTAEFAPRKGRYLRLRVPRTTQFHLHEVAVR